MTHQNYVVIGNGRVAKHTLHYFDLLHIPYQHWHRSSGLSLSDTVAAATHVLVLISDSAIDSFIDENWNILSQKKIIHFSGAHNSERAFSAHPLMTFHLDLYEDAMYRTIPFVITQEGPEFETLLPGLPNRHYAIPKHMKPYYHALCVMATNFSVLLWQKMSDEFANQLHIPHDAILPILGRTFENLKNPKEALTGPLARHDQNTIHDNLKSLEKDPFYAVYQGFLKAYTEQEKK